MTEAKGARSGKADRAHGDSGGPMIDFATGRIAGVVSTRGSIAASKDAKDARDGEAKEGIPVVVGVSPMACKETILAALAR